MSTHTSPPRRTLLRGAAGALTGLAVLVVAGCSTGSNPTSPSTSAGSGAARPMSLWAHQGNAPAEAEPLQKAVTAWNAQHPEAPVTVKFIPENDYPTTLAAAPSDALPDILEVNGPTVAAEVRAKRLIEIGSLLSQGTVSNLTGSIRDQGTVAGKLFVVGQFSGAIGIYANKRLLDSAGVKYPTSLADTWTADEFTAAVKVLAERNTVLPGKSLDLKLNYNSNTLTGEFGTFAFSPLVWSAGGDLLRDGKATGVLNSPQNVDVLATVASWRPYVTANTSDTDFVDGKVALSWVGHWVYNDYRKALGSDLLALPVPDFGRGPKGGAGSWAWGITPNSATPSKAAAFLDFLLNDDNVSAMVAVNSAIPGTTSVLKTSTLYDKGAPLGLWGELATRAPGVECASGTATPLPDGCGAVVRPRTAGYPKVTQEFANALDAAFKGADPRAVLDKAASNIDTDFADNGGYR